VHASVGKANVALCVRCAPVVLSPKRSTALGTIVDELLTTALTRRFPEERRGTVLVQSRPLPDDRIEITVADDGVSEPAQTGPEASYHRQLLERLTAHANATIRYELDGGTRCIITVDPD
jgi:two-component sensor histidine kinase